MIVKEFRKTTHDFDRWIVVLEDNKKSIVTFLREELTITAPEDINSKTVYSFLHREHYSIKHRHLLTDEQIKRILKFNGFTFQTEKIYDVDYENFKDNNTAEAFQHWWNEEGSAIRPEDDEDTEEFAKRICGIAWNNGSFKGTEI